MYKFNNSNDGIYDKYITHLSKDDIANGEDLAESLSRRLFSLQLRLDGSLLDNKELGGLDFEMDMGVEDWSIGLTPYKKMSFMIVNDSFAIEDGFRTGRIVEPAIGIESLDEENKQSTLHVPYGSYVVDSVAKDLNIKTYHCYDRMFYIKDTDCDFEGETYSESTTVGYVLNKLTSKYDDVVTLDESHKGDFEPYWDHVLRQPRKYKDYEGKEKEEDDDELFPDTQEPIEDHFPQDAGQEPADNPGKCCDCKPGQGGGGNPGDDPDPTPDPGDDPDPTPDPDGKYVTLESSTGSFDFEVGVPVTLTATLHGIEDFEEDDYYIDILTFRKSSVGGPACSFIEKPYGYCPKTKEPFKVVFTGVGEEDDYTICARVYDRESDHIPSQEFDELYVPFTVRPHATKNKAELDGWDLKNTSGGGIYGKKQYLYSQTYSVVYRNDVAVLSYENPHTGETEYEGIVGWLGRTDYTIEARIPLFTDYLNSAFRPGYLLESAYAVIRDIGFTDPGAELESKFKGFGCFGVKHNSVFHWLPNVSTDNRTYEDFVNANPLEWDYIPISNTPIEYAADTKRPFSLLVEPRSQICLPFYHYENSSRVVFTGEKIVLYFDSTCFEDSKPEYNDEIFYYTVDFYGDPIYSDSQTSEVSTASYSLMSRSRNLSSPTYDDSGNLIATYALEDYTNTPNKDGQVLVDTPEEIGFEMTEGQLLGYIAAYCGGNIFLDHNNEMRLLKLVDSVDEESKKVGYDKLIPHSQVAIPEIDNCDASSKLGGLIVHVSTYEGDDIIIGSKKPSNTLYTIEIDNPYMTEERAQEIYDEMSKVTYFPMRCVILSDPRLWLGDMLYFEQFNMYNEMSGSNVEVIREGYYPIMKLTSSFDGAPSLQVETTSSKGSDRTNSFTGTLNDKVDEVSAKTKENSKAVNELKTQFDEIKAVVGYINELFSIEITADNIVTATINTKNIRIAPTTGTEGGVYIDGDSIDFIDNEGVQRLHLGSSGDPQDYYIKFLNSDGYTRELRALTPDGTGCGSGDDTNDSTNEEDNSNNNGDTSIDDNLTVASTSLDDVLTSLQNRIAELEAKLNESEGE